MYKNKTLVQHEYDKSHSSNTLWFNSRGFLIVCEKKAFFFQIVELIEKYCHEGKKPPKAREGGEENMFNIHILISCHLN